MLWFNKKERKKRMEFIQNYVPTSKAQLLQVAMWYHKGNVDKAQEMVDFYSKNLDLPDFDPVQPTIVQQVKGGASDLFAWIKNNQSDIVQGYNFIQGIIRNRGVVPAIEEPLPPINE